MLARSPKRTRSRVSKVRKVQKRTRSHVSKPKKSAKRKSWIITDYTDADLPSELRSRNRMAAYHAEDPKKVIWRGVGDISQFKMKGNWVLLGVYQRPSRLKSGLHVSDLTLAEDEWQGKVGLILKLGPRAYVDDATISFHPDDKSAVNDWAMMWVTDGRKLKINGYLCRMVRDFEIRSTIPHPDMVY